MTTTISRVLATLLAAQNQTLKHLQRIERGMAELLAGQSRLEARIMATEQELDEALQTLGRNLTDLGQNMLDAINSLKNKLPPSVDLSDELNTVTQMANEAVRLGNIAKDETVPVQTSPTKGG